MGLINVKKTTTPKENLIFTCSAKRVGVVTLTVVNRSWYVDRLGSKTNMPALKYRGGLGPNSAGH